MDSSEIAWEDCIASLPPLASLSSPSSDLPTPDLLSLLSPSPPPSKPPSSLDATLISASLDPLIPSSLSNCTTSSSSTLSTPSSPPCDLLTELQTRLSSSITETQTLRRRVASLVDQNRTLRAALDHANARLLAVAQAASAPVAVMEDGRERKKRKRVSGAAATTMACVMFMWGALMGGVREGGNLPVVWKAAGGEVRRWEGACGGALGELPSGKEKDEEMDLGDAYGYVLCREMGKAAESVRECERRMENGQICGVPHTLSLIVPTERNGTDIGLAEVVCSIDSVARVQDVDMGERKGKVIGVVKEEMHVVKGQ